jgi:hypothetical protein
LRRLSFLILTLLLLPGIRAGAQQAPQPGIPVTLQNAPQRDTTNRSAKGDWHDEPVTIYSTTLYSAVRRYLPDSEIHNFQRRPFIQPYYRDLGNHGTPVRSQLFRPENLGHTGPSLGYHVYDVYRFRVDSLRYYNTTRPYTSFSYQLGSKLEQTMRLMHTQNISARWNFMAQYQKINSAGYYRLQRSNHDAGALSTNYNSKNQRYQLYSGVVYNKEQTDENGGITSDTFLNLNRDRQTIPVVLDNPSYTNAGSQGRRSSYTNTLRDFNVMLRHQYTLGRYDTSYSADSTQYAINLVPRFSVEHRFEAGSEKHKFKSLIPDSTVWASFFNRGFATADSVYTEQYWSWLDNRATISGFVGKGGQQLAASVGIGNRIDAFYTDWSADREKISIISTYLTGEVRKEAITQGSWGYGASAKFIIAGSAVGNFILQGSLSKDFGRLGSVNIGGSQQLTDAPYAYTLYANEYFRQQASLSKESITNLYGEVRSQRLGLMVGVRNYLIGNYVYLQDSLEQVSNGKLQLSQASGAVNLTQVYARKLQRFGKFVFDVDGAFQAAAGDAPVNVPALVARTGLSFESPVFNGALNVATGVDLRYHTPYKAEGYSPFYNRFYYQNSYTSDNFVEGSVFFNFRVKRMRAYLMLDQLQALWLRNSVVHPGYPSQEMMIRFGFEWVMIN